MPTNYVLVDFENVQPEDFQALRDPRYRVKIFLGVNQAKIPVELAAALQPMGDFVEYVRLTTGGPNSLDFAIAYHIGALSAKDPKGYFHIISRDTGFDPLIAHLRSQKLCVTRRESLETIPTLHATPAAAPVQPTAPAPATASATALPGPQKATPATAKAAAKKSPATNTLDPDLQHVIEHLKKLKTARPRKVQTLQNSLKTIFKSRPGVALEPLIMALIKNGVVQQNGDMITYRL